nr:hypothetical protein [Tanacetum cinerariifolium]
TETTSTPQPKKPQVTQNTEKGKSLMKLRNQQKKLVPASREVRQDHDEPIIVPYDILGKIYQLTNDEIQAHLDKEDIKKKG